MGHLLDFSSFLAFCNVFSHLNRKGYGVETKPIRFVELPIISPPRFSVERTMVLLRKLRALVMYWNQIIIQVKIVIFTYTFTLTIFLFIYSKRGLSI